jgi:hypothetical protein
MGTPCACAYATIYYSYHKETSLLVPGAHSLVFYRRLIDDALILQRHTADGWSHFMHAMDDFGPPGKRLKWESEDGPGRSSHFLDLEIHLQEDGSIQTRTYQKDMNLYLYCPPLLPSWRVSFMVSSTGLFTATFGRIQIDLGLITLWACPIDGYRIVAMLPLTLLAYSFVRHLGSTSHRSQKQNQNAKQWPC